MFRITLNMPNIHLDSDITLRTDSTGWDTDIPGERRNAAWEFNLHEEGCENGLSFKFVLERRFWMKGSNLFVVPVSGQTYSYSADDIQFPDVQEDAKRGPSAAPGDLNLPQLLVAGMGFLPLLGLPFSIIAIVWGLLIRKRRGTKLVLLGAAGPILSHALIVCFVAFVSPMIFNGPTVKKRANKFLVTTLIGAGEEIEAFRRASGRYPAKLNEMAQSPRYLLVYDPIQPTQMIRGYAKQPTFYYQRLSNPPGYYLFSVGEDGKPFTSDDVLPTPNKATPGMRLPSKPL